MVLNRQNVAHKQMRVLINWHSVGFPHRRCATTETSDEKMSFGNIFMFFISQLEPGFTPYYTWKQSQNVISNRRAGEEILVTVQRGTCSLK